MLYSAVVLAAMIGIGILMMTVVVPKLVDIFKELGTELPLATRVMIKMSDLLVDHRWIFLGLFIGLAIVFKMLQLQQLGLPLGSVLM